MAQFFTTKDVAAKLGISMEQVRARARAGEFAGVQAKKGARWQLSKQQFESVIKQAGGGAAGKVRIEWYDEKLKQILQMSMKKRLMVCAQIVRDRVVRNLSRPVHKYRGKRSGRIQVDPASRSKPGEFPKADTTRLMKDIFWELIDDRKAVVGTTLDYGLLLEANMNRSFLRRTLLEMQPTISRILLKKI